MIIVTTFGRPGYLLGFFAGIATLVRGTSDGTAWLSLAISAAAAVLVAVHLINVGIEYTANHLSKASPAHEPLHAVGGALFTLGMLPLGVAVVASAAVGLVCRVVPRWLAWVGLVLGLTALVNGDHARIRGSMGIPHRHHLGIHQRHSPRPTRHQHSNGAPDRHHRQLTLRGAVSVGEREASMTHSPAIRRQ